MRVKYFTELVIDYAMDFMKICRDAQPRVCQINYKRKTGT